MKEQMETAVLPSLPIVGKLELTTLNGLSLRSITVTNKKETVLTPFFEACFNELELFLSGQRRSIHIDIDLNDLTQFQRRIFDIMKLIPYGSTVTYKDIADQLQTKAYQSIGSACGRNPFLLIYPCHRVVGTGNIGGFAHGLRMKRELLRLEGGDF